MNDYLTDVQAIYIKLDEIKDELESISCDEKLRPLSFRDQCAIVAIHIRCLNIERHSELNPGACAKVAFDIADAMESERKKRNESAK